jgi:hypothetical protein
MKCWQERWRQRHSRGVKVVAALAMRGNRARDRKKNWQFLTFDSLWHTYYPLFNTFNHFQRCDTRWTNCWAPSHNDDGTRDNDDDVTSTDTPTKDDVSKRKSYLEALLQWAESLTLCDLLVKIGSIHLFVLLVSVCLDWMTVAST